MIVSLLLGRKGSQGFPGKNLFKVLGHELAWYPMEASKRAGVVDHIYLSTNDPELILLGKKNGIKIIERPEYLCTNEALGEDAYKHGYHVIREELSCEIDLLVLLFCNAPTVSPQQIRAAVNIMREKPNLDSAVTVSRYNMWSPLRARRITTEGLLVPFVDHTLLGKNLSCDRDSQGDVWFADVALAVVRPQNFDKIENGLLPQKWMGRRIFPIKNEAGLDVDFEWQVPQVEWWLKKHWYKDGSNGGNE